MDTSKQAVRVEVFADVGCPFAHVGLRRFVEHRSQLGRDDVVLRVRPWPLELVNGEPLDAAFIAEEVDEIREQVAPDLFVGFVEQAFPASTIAAMATAELAYEASDALGEQVSLALRDALFEHGRPIATSSDLEAILAECSLHSGIDADIDLDGDLRDVVERSWRAGEARGVTGSPHFFVASDGFFCPALDIEHVDGHLRIGTDRVAWDHFLDAVFAGPG